MVTLLRYEVCLRIQKNTDITFLYLQGNTILEIQWRQREIWYNNVTLYSLEHISVYNVYTKSILIVSGDH